MRNKGITLIALVITIVVLLILAGISLNTVLGENGIINKARESNFKTTISRYSEEFELYLASLKLDDENFSRITINASENDLSLYINDIEEEFKNKLCIEDGKLVAIFENMNNDEIEWSKDLGLTNITREIEKDWDNISQNVNLENRTNPDFYVCDNNGNKLIGYDALFDKDLSTYIDIRGNGVMTIKWNGDIIGKSILVKCNEQGNSSYYIKYVNDEGEELDAYKPNGESSQYLNWQSSINSRESITYVPEGATALKLYNADKSGWYFYEIQLFEEGKFESDNYIEDVKISGLTANKVNISWKQSENVTSVKIYKDSTFISETTESSYLITSNLLNNTTYKFYLEPITSDSTENTKNEKISFFVTTRENISKFYIEGINELQKKYYANLFDSNLSTYIDTKGKGVMTIKWNGDITGKQIMVKTHTSATSSYYIKYVNDEGEELISYKPNGETTQNLNWQSGESITYVPEEATALKLCNADSYGWYFYEIQLFEEGMYTTTNITNVEIIETNMHSLKFKWDKNENVSKTVIYQDGVKIAETTECEYTVNSGLITNTEYIYYLEPITVNTTDNVKNKKAVIKGKTTSDGVDFYVLGTEGISKKVYKNLFDSDLSTYIDANGKGVMTIKWNGDITGKQIMVKTHYSGNSNYYIKYVNGEGEELDAYKPNGETTQYLNWQSSGESITYVPEGATELRLYNQGCSRWYFYEIKIVE